MRVGKPLAMAPPSVRTAPSAPGLDHLRSPNPIGEPRKSEVLLHDSDQSLFDHVEKVARWGELSVGDESGNPRFVNMLLQSSIDCRIFGEGLLEPIDAYVGSAGQGFSRSIERSTHVRVDKDLRIRAGGLTNRVDDQDVPFEAFT